MAGQALYHAKSPLEKGSHPELNDSEPLDEKGGPAAPVTFQCHVTPCSSTHWVARCCCRARHDDVRIGPRGPAAALPVSVLASSYKTLMAELDCSKLPDTEHE